MGNNISSTERSTVSSAKSFIRMKFQRKKEEKKQIDEYIIEFDKICSSDAQTSASDCMSNTDNKRMVFVSIIGAYQTWENCPSYILYSSLLILPLKRKWIYDPTKYFNEIQSTFLTEISSFNADSEKLQRFIRFLKWKDSQKLAFWILDNDFEQLTGGDKGGGDKKAYRQDVANNNENILIAPFWRDLSHKLTNLYDPVTGNNYKPLIFAEKWWTKQFNKQKNIKCKYLCKTSSILAELYLLTMKYKAMQEIIYQSNQSLNPITFYGIKDDNSVKITQDSDDHNVDKDYDENEGEWFISTDYDPDDISPEDIDSSNVVVGIYNDP